MPKYLTVKQVVERLREHRIERSIKTIYRWCDEGRVFKNVRRFNGSVYISEVEIERVIKEDLCV